MGTKKARSDTSMKTWAVGWGCTSFFGKSTTKHITFSKISPRYDGPARHDNPWAWALLELLGLSNTMHSGLGVGPARSDPRPSLNLLKKPLSDFTLSSNFVLIFFKRFQQNYFDKNNQGKSISIWIFLPENIFHKKPFFFVNVSVITNEA